MTMTSPSDESMSISARAHVDADSPLRDFIAAHTASDRAQLVALSATSESFLTDVIDHLNPVNQNPGQPYRHATLAETVQRFTRPSTGEKGTGDNGTSEDKTAEDETGEDRAALPNFPRFRLNRTPYSWVHDLAQTDDIAEIAALRGTTTLRTFSHIVTAITLTHGLPAFRQRCERGEFTIAHAEAAAHLCRNVHFTHLPTIDAFLSTRRADMTIESFRRSLQSKITVLQPLEDRMVEAHRRRRVDIATSPDGTAYLTLTGPAAELHAMYQRIHAIAKAIRTGNTKVFDAHLPEGTAIDDDRTIMALMFDIITRSDPQLDLEIVAIDTTTGRTSTSTVPLDIEGVRSPDDLVDVINDTAAAEVTSSGTDGEVDEGTEAVSVDGDGDDTEQAEVTAAAHQRVTTDPVTVADLPDWASRSPVDTPGTRYQYRITCDPTTFQQWFATQARVMTTVPLMTLLGLTDLPGTLPDGSPIPAAMVRQLAAYAPTWSRILTDPAEGSPVDARARTYHVPPDIRRTLVAAWQWCSVPGCTNPALGAEIDHIEAFNQDDPDAGGLTTFMNTHPLCGLHHQAKTDRKYRVRRSAPGELEYTFKHGIMITTSPPDNQVDVEQARLFTELLGAPPPPRTAPTGPDEEQDILAKYPPARAPELSASDVGEGDSDAARVLKPGDMRHASRCPGPRAAAGSPGWVKRSELDRSTQPQTEWVWNSGEPPPF